MQHLRPNITLQGGKYRIERVLGQGGFGITYLAMQSSLQRKVAIKEFFMKDFCSRDEATSTMQGASTGSNKLVEQYKRKFIKEARNLARLSHPNIINVIDVFEENDTVYYVMPYLSGGSLQDYIKSRGAISETEAMKYVRQIAKALKYMHEEQHMCHFDVKPANIMLDDKGDAILIDFGISKGYDEGGHETSTTPVGLSEGYAPIEQYQQGLEEFSPASDVYALGATLYFLLHGKRPVSAIDRVSGTLLSVNSSLSESIKMIIDASMKVSKTERAKDVDVFIKGASSAPPSRTEPVPQEKSNGWFFFIVLLIIGVCFGVYMSEHKPSDDSPIEQVLYEDFYDNNTSEITNNENQGSNTINTVKRNSSNKEDLIEIEEDAASIRKEGYDYYYGRNGKKINYIKAVELYKKAANMGDESAQYYLGNAYEEGIGVEKDYEEAIKWYKKSANQGYVLAQSHLGGLYYFGEAVVSQNFGEAFKWLRMAANNNDASSQTILGDAYNYGKGVDVNYTEAVKWYTKAALQGISNAQVNLGALYKNGLGVMKDEVESVKWFLKAAEQNDSYAQRRLGYAYWKGEGVDVDYAAAFKWMKMSADQNDSMALYYLGYMYLRAEGVRQDFDEAYLAFKRSADLGNRDSQSVLRNRDYWPTMFNLNK